MQDVIVVKATYKLLSGAAGVLMHDKVHGRHLMMILSLSVIVTGKVK